MVALSPARVLQKQMCECGKESRYALCDSCWQSWQGTSQSAPYFKEVGTENPMDKKGSTAHIRDIKSRRINPTTGEVFNYTGEKTYFFPKGK